ncbi:bacillithiol biosynthesis cysteine-adding enzyme BshC [Staphylococcus sp. ACRSN]|uniref:bacillithiol biosynthesis cysteine-adding enzyme BshC n=1 Tax=Staphylococcus sp. ACRSN TaxID=2918214 RepID=UPI001EF30B2A|nr:bacillithiol biosynthesis cysteine-adding enzyme BshC [Staphylococcus sp. ACRSN]MCG7338724.1 bacillithiol biosynthesis cysteine-adding enzyme BshC [Staphylococcus sp. ACRSN]
MYCMTERLNENDQFINKLKNSDHTLAQFYHLDAMNPNSYIERLEMKNNGREVAVANVIENYMSDLTLTSKQIENIDALRNGAKVIVGGQQAGLFGGPLYTLHKIFSIITMSEELKQKYGKAVVPVFWIAGEDHDFDEVNHTFAYNSKKAKLHKIKYHTMTPPESNVSRYSPDKEELNDTLNQFFQNLPETKHSQSVIQLFRNIIDKHQNWTEMFKALLHEVFKDYGVLLIDANYSELRKIEQPLIKQLIQQHKAIDSAFRTTQDQTIANGLTQMIKTDTNVHLFLHEDDMRQLITFKDGEFKLSKSDKTYSESELLTIVEEEPERFSNNVVTRPIMEEWLFNTVAFIGGPSEIKYWAELSDVFKVVDVSMPIVMPRLRISYINERTEKLLKQYGLELNKVLSQGINEDKERFVRAKASSSFIEEVENMKEQQEKLYETLKVDVSENNDNRLLLEKNNEIHQQQYDYLLKRYLLNIERENDISMKHFNEINEVLHPMGGLQERIWNTIQIMNEFGIDVFSPSTYPPLSYTFDHIILKP